MRRIIKKYFVILDGSQRKQLAVIFGLMLIGAFLEVLGVSLMLPLMTAIMNPDIIYTNEIVKAICELLGLQSHKTFVILCILVLIVVFIVKDLFLLVQYYVQIRFVGRSRLLTQRKLLSSYLSRDYEYFLNAQSSEIIKVIQLSVGHTYFLLSMLLSMGTETIVSLFLVATVFVVDPVMTVFMGAVLGLAMLVTIKVLRPKMKRQGVIYQDSHAKTLKWLQQSIHGIKEIKVTQKETFFEKEFDKNGNKLITAETLNTVANSVPRFLIEMVSVCSVLALIAVQILMGKDIESLVPSLAVLALAAMRLMPGANRIVNTINSIPYYEPAVDATIDNLRQSSVEVIKTTAEKGQGEYLSLKESLDLKSVSYKYPRSESMILVEADMQIPVGKSVGVVGASGAGKTTVIDILLGVLKPEKGVVTADGTDIHKDYSGWLSKVGYIPQAVFMLNGSIRDNVAFGLAEDEVREEQVWQALEEAQLASFVRALPKGLDTQIGERGVRLSGGQRQRIGIARALYLDPELLVFDEATSALDNETEGAIMDSINCLKGKKTIVIIAHRLQTIENCDIVYRVENQKIIRER